MLLPGRVEVISGEDQVARGVGGNFPFQFVVGTVSADLGRVGVDSGAVDVAVGQYRFVCPKRRFGAVGECEGAGSFVAGMDVEVLLVGGHERPASPFPSGVDLEVAKRTITAIKNGGDTSSAGYQQPLGSRHQSALGTDAGERRRTVRLFLVLGSGGVIHPPHRAIAGVERVQESPHEGPNAGPKIDGVVAQHRSTARRPGGDQSPVSNGVLRVGRAAETPLERSIGCPQAVQKPVVATEIDAIVSRDGWQTNRRFGEKRPALHTGAGIERDQLVAVV